MVGRQLLNPRGGSVAEDEVSSLIRRIAFLNRPLAPDDIGADFVCSVAHRRNVGRETERSVPMLYAGSWFLLSVKAGDAKVGLEREKGHFDWFTALEVPFLIAQVEPDADLRVTVYHSLQHVEIVKSLPDSVQSVEFRCHTSSKNAPRTYQQDRSDVIEIDGNRAVAFLGPPLLDLTRRQLVDASNGVALAQLLQTVCDFHPDVTWFAREGMASGLFWETNESIDWGVKSMSLPAIARSSRTVLKAVESVLRCQQKELPQRVFEASKPLFRLFSALSKSESGTITQEEVFTDAGDHFLKD